MEIESRSILKIAGRFVTILGLIAQPQQILAQGPTVEVSQYCTSAHPLLESPLLGPHLDIGIIGFNITTEPLGVLTTLENSSGKQVIVDFDPSGHIYHARILHSQAVSINGQQSIKFEAGESYKISLNKALDEDRFKLNPPLGERLAWVEFTASSCSEWDFPPLEGEI